MAVIFENSKTKENLMKAFAGESQARNRYTIAGEEARKQKMYSISEIFFFTADQERAHAERYYGLLKPFAGETIEICGGYPVDYSEKLEDLLKSAQHNEMQEYEDVYPTFGKVATEEGFLEAAAAFYQIAEIEAIHGKRFASLAEMLTNNTYFEREGEGAWMCMYCGHIYRGKNVPQLCPVCRRERGYFIPVEFAPYLKYEYMDHE